MNAFDYMFLGVLVVTLPVWLPFWLIGWATYHGVEWTLDRLEAWQKKRGKA